MLGSFILKHNYNSLKVGQVMFNQQQQNRSLMKLSPDRDTSSISTAAFRLNAVNGTKAPRGRQGPGSDKFQQTYER